MNRTTRAVTAGALAVTTLATLAGFAAAPADVPTKKPKQAAVTIYLTRHGETMLNTLERAQGWSDSPLTEEGRLSAEHLGEGLAESGVKFEAAYSADMVRHWETVSLALDELGAKRAATRDERLREISFGKFEGAKNMEMWSAIATELGYANVGELFADPNFDFMAGLSAVARLNEGSGLVAETPEQVAARAVEALDEIAAKQSADGGGEVLVVSSGITIMLALGTLGADLSEITNGIENGAVSELVYDRGEWTIKTVNDLSYVEAGSD
ncbi:hypothetical protein ASE14_08465 [Agromyces sp. Root81]|uniref:histidine phosphatase family protein n=1 Tax=Agromyces sp. Root81 TaxID=1736601 RepID=UPI0006F69FE2|nr:histidine phosphatase family protein [Agromyces sp. Root81]KRC60976.1 hypothetical protein ASE14_08465 [Agromyces sp. Root81]